MAVSINRDRGGRAAMTADRLRLRRRHEGGGRRFRDATWRPLLVTEAAGSDRVTVERQRLSQGQSASPTRAMALSLLAHVACLIAIIFFLHDRPTSPDTPGTTQVAMVFRPAPATVPAVPAAPASMPVVVPRPPEPPAEAALTTEPPAAPPAPVQPPTASVPEPPAPPPVPTASTPTEHLARIIPKPSPPPERTAPAQRQAALRPYNPPRENRVGPTAPPSPAPAQAQPTDLAASRPMAAGPLIPPRPVAGMETNRAPAYPEIALRRGESGRVMLRVSVSAYGRPLEVAVAQSSGYPILDEAALAAVRQWQFVPATQAGIPVAAIADVPVRFRIDN